MEGLPTRRGAPIVLVVGEGDAARETERDVRHTAGAPATLVAPNRLEGALRGQTAGSIALVLAGTELAKGWLDGLEAAAGADGTVATASAISPGGPWGPAGDGALRPDAADSIRRNSVRLRPRLLAPHWPCVLVRRAALDLAGVPAGEPVELLAELGEGCTARGLLHVLADDVLVRGPNREPGLAAESRLSARWPHRAVAAALDRDRDLAPRRAVLAATRELAAPSVTIDGRALGPRRAGTQVHALELIAALARTGRLALRVVTPPDLAEDARELFQASAVIETLPYAEAAAEPQVRTAIVHRPSQIFTADDLALLVPLGERLVVTHQDLIAYRIPGYHASPEEWLLHRRATRGALAAADHTVFFTHHALQDALADDLVNPGAASVVPIGADHLVTGRLASRRPDRLDGHGPPFLVCLGAALPHKNRRFAVDLHVALQRLGWNGSLVFAGPREGIRGGEHERCLDLGQVGEAEKAWLLANAAAVVYPTVYEGFGLVPFEAGRAGVPCLFAAVSALAEVLPAELATLVPWDADASAAAVRGLLEPGPRRRTHADGLRAAGERYTWDATARALVAVYERVLAQPVTEARRGARDRIELERRLLEVQHEREVEFQRFAAFRQEVGSDGLGLVGPGGVLSAQDQRALLAVASRDVVKRPLLGAVRAAYALARRLR